MEGAYLIEDLRHNGHIPVEREREMHLMISVDLAFISQHNELYPKYQTANAVKVQKIPKIFVATLD